MVHCITMITCSLMTTVMSVCSLQELYQELLFEMLLVDFAFINTLVTMGSQSPAPVVEWHDTYLMID